jgi:hypothetical protein
MGLRELALATFDSRRLHHPSLPAAQKVSDGKHMLRHKMNALKKTAKDARHSFSEGGL